MSLRRHAVVSRVMLSCAVATVLAAAAHADITVEEKISFNGLGGLKLTNMSGSTKTAIAGDRARTESNLQFESGMLRAFTRGAGQMTEIVRLDQDKIYTLDTNKKTYTEATFAEQRAKMQQAMQGMQQAQASQSQGASGVDESQCEWSPPKSEVQRTGEKALIAGMQAERVTVIATQSCKDKQTGQVCDFGLVLDQYIAPGFQHSEETLAYYRAYAEKMGLNAAASRDFAERAQSMFGRYKDIWAEVGAKMKDIQGYSVKTSFGLGVGGPQCQNSQNQQQAQQEAQSAPPPSLGGAIGGAIGGMFKKKEPAPAQPAAAPQMLPGGLVPIMTLGTELVSLSQAAVPAQTFEVPADYKKKSAD